LGSDDQVRPPDGTPLVHRRHSEDDEARAFDELTIQLTRKKEKCLGICVSCPKSTGFPLIVDIVEGSLAFLDGKLVKGDRIVSVNDQDMSGATPEKAAAALRAAFTFASPTINFKVRRLRKP
jgi:C-terminal processing protease CtpA/Prc